MHITRNIKFQSRFADLMRKCTLASFLGILLMGSSDLRAAERLPVITNQNTGVVYNNLQQAISAASAQDILKINGTCVGNFIINKDLTLTGGSEAILDGNRTGSVVTVAGGGSDVLLENLTIQNGLATFGGGILNQGRLLISNCEVIHNTANQLGGGIFNLNVVSLFNSKLGRNTSVKSGGGLFSNGGAVNFINTKVSNNIAEGGPGNAGGGILVQGAVLTISSSLIINNVAAHTAGGGIAAVASSTTLNHVHVTSNNAGQGAGIYNAAGALIINDSLIHKNQTFTSGGGLFNDTAGVATLNDSIVRHNTAVTTGGGIFSVAASTLNLNDTKVTDNEPNDVVKL